MLSKLNIAIVGATGRVGRTFLQVLPSMGLPLGEVVLFSSHASKGKKLPFGERILVVEELTEEAIDGKRFQYALFSAGGDISKTFAPLFRDRGIQVIDNSSAFRMEKDVPLVVPEVNPKEAMGHLLIANPNCSTIQSVLPLKVVKDLFGLKRVSYTTYQAVSGSGQKGVEDLKRTLKGEAPSFYPRSIAGNCIPQIDVFLADGYTKEEVKMIEETRKILELPKLPVTATCVRVPVENGHSVAVNVTCEKDLDLEVLKRAFQRADGIIFYEDGYPVAEDANGRDEVLLGRLRQDESMGKSLHFWCVADNVRKGAATNALQILKIVWEERS